ncbi:MAG: carboxylating nicotinate-nucleotide diphosphorylase [Kiritimatiellaeota bacterium]|nr:carboxylating nicotinate-nucleotide diphosphorylase [Kiritimatiellota bacterium]
MSLPEFLEHREVRELISRALIEDVGAGDITSEALVGAGDRAKASIVSRGHYLLAGGPVAELVFKTVDTQVKSKLLIADGSPVRPGDTILQVEGRARGLLVAERTALNFIQQMTGIATLTHQFVERVAPYGVHILDTRKTSPSLRILQKYAVHCGGGVNHRMGLYDRILIKDNHLAFWGRHGTGNPADAVRLARKKFPGVEVEIEVESEADLRKVIEAAPDWILLDNMPPAKIRRCVEINANRCKLEASGGVTLATVAAIAVTGVHAISVGCLTHSPAAADLSLEFVY